MVRLFHQPHRKGDVQFGDLATLLGVVDGGAITALFGEGKTALFGAYGLGLAFGFFAYFFTLILLVRLSKGVYTVTWFLDGWRKKLEADEDIHGETRPTVAPMAVQLGGPQLVMASSVTWPDRASRLLSTSAIERSRR